MSGRMLTNFILYFIQQDWCRLFVDKSLGVGLIIAVLICSGDIVKITIEQGLEIGYAE